MLSRTAPATPMAETITPTDLTGRLSGSRPPTVIDVRTPAEYGSAHIPGSLNIPLPLVQTHADQLAGDLDGPVVLVCQAGPRARAAHDALTAAGAGQLTVLDGGVAAHGSSGQPVHRGRPHWTLERQVRLVAGSVVAASVLASLRFPRIRFLAGGVGAGLAAAAITDTCAMGAALARMPFNRGGRPIALADARAALRS